MTDRSATPPMTVTLRSAEGVRVLPVAALPLLLAACGGNAATAGAQAPDAQASPVSSPTPTTTQDQTMQDNQAIKQGIDALLAADLSDSEALNHLLSARLQDAPSTNPYFTVRRGASGSLAGVALGEIELRTSKDNPAKAMVNVKFTQPTGNAEALVRGAWPDAEFAPPRPNAADSSAFWSARQGDAKVVVSQAPGGGAVAAITIDRIP